MSETKALQLYNSALHTCLLACKCRTKTIHSIILGFVHVHAIPGGNIVVFKITVSPSGFGGHRNVVADHPSSCVVTYWRKAGDARFRQRLTDPAVYDEGVAMVPA